MNQKTLVNVDITTFLLTLESPEKDIFRKYTPELEKTTFGSKEYKEHLKKVEVALKHHYANNSHHPEHYPNGIRGMDLLDIVEMICDWKASSVKHKGDIYNSIKIGKERFNYSSDLEQIFNNTAKLFEKENMPNQKDRVV